MQTKISFELIAFEEAKIFSKISNIEVAMERYYKLVENFGWSIEDYEAEMLQRIDLN